MMNVFARNVKRSVTPFVKGTAVSRFRLFSTKYTECHEFIKVDGDIGTVGISHRAAEALGDIVFVDLPSVGSVFESGESFGSVESVKAANDVYLPVGGEVLEVNEALDGSPETVNESPYEKGWFVKIKVTDPADLDKLMDQSAYDNFKE